MKAEQRKAPRLAIIGGGIAGLMAAYRSQARIPQATIDLFEASQHLGGWIRSERVDDFLVEHGPESIVRHNPIIDELLHELELESEVITTQADKRGAYVLHRGQLQRIPTGFWLLGPTQWRGLLTSPLLSPWGKLGLLRDLFKPLPALRETTSIAELVRSRFGNELMDNLVEAMVGGMYATDPAQLSVAALMPHIAHAMQQSKSLRAALHRLQQQRQSQVQGARYGLFISFRHGLETLCHALVKQLAGVNIHLSTRIQSLTQRQDKRWQLHAAKHDHNGAYDALIIALPSRHIAALFNDINPRLATDLNSIDHGSCAAVSLGWQHKQAIDHSLDAYGVLIPAKAKRPMLAMTWSSSKYALRAPDEGALIRIFLGGHQREDYSSWEDARLRDLALCELQHLLPITQAPDLVRVHRFSRAMPHYGLNHQRIVQRIDAQLQGYANLACANNSFYGVGIPETLQAATKAVEKIAATLI